MSELALQVLLAAGVLLSVVGLRAWLRSRRQPENEPAAHNVPSPEPDTTTEELDDELLEEQADAIDDAVADSPDPTVRPDVVSDLVSAADAHRD